MNDRKSNSSPPSALGGASWFREELNKKANDELVRSEMDNINEKLDETKKIALSARKKANEPSEFQRLKLVAILGMFVIIIAWLGQWYSLKYKTDTTEGALTSLAEKQSQDTKDIKESVVKVEKAVNDHLIEYKKTQKSEEKSKESDKKALLKDISNVFKAEMKKSRRRGSY